MRTPYTVRLLVVAAVVASSLAVAPAAQAQSVTVTPPSGDFSTEYLFAGRGWVAGRTITAQYYRFDVSPTVCRTFTFRPGRNGNFVFRLIQPVVSVDSGNGSRICFSQRNTRGRTVRRCPRFYVAPATARVEPADGQRGDTFLLNVAGWRGGDRLVVELIRPDGSVNVTSLTTRALPGGFVFAGNPFGNVFVARGGGLSRFLADASAAPGVYTFFVHREGENRGPRTAFRVIG